MNKVKNIIYIAFGAICVALLCFVSGRNSEKPWETALLQGMSVKYWIVDLDAALITEGAWLYADIETSDGILRRHKLLELSAIPTRRLVAALQKQADNYVLFVCDDNASTVSCKMDKEAFDSSLLIFNSESSLRPNIFMVKGGHSEVGSDFSKLHKGEIGIRLRVEI